MGRLFLLLMISVSLVNANFGGTDPGFEWNRTLRSLFLRAEIVVLAEVTQVEEIELDPVSWNDRRAILSVTTWLKGEQEQATLTVEFSASQGCPPQPTYVAGQTMLVFLSSFGPRKQYFPMNGNLGAQWVRRIGETEIFRFRLKELGQALLLEDTDTRFRAQAEWLVKCAEHRYTRWDALRDLCKDRRVAPAPPKFGHEIPDNSPSFWSLLDPELRGRLLALPDEIHHSRIDKPKYVLKVMKILSKSMMDPWLLALTADYEEVNGKDWLQKKEEVWQEFRTWYLTLARIRQEAANTD
jgi:hypothetical protein